MTAYAGLDLASVRDVSAFVLIIPEDDRFTVIPYFFAPKDNAFIRSRRDQVDYYRLGERGIDGTNRGRCNRLQLHKIVE